MDLQKIKYIADRYYINLDGFDLNNLNNFATDATFSMQQAIYIHEYYHYLTNITTFFGVRQFNCAFQDKVRLITILLKKAGLDAFPIGTNSRADCAYEIEYCKSVDDIMNLDDLDKDFYEKVMKSPNKRFTITNYTKKFIPVSAVKDGVLQKGAHSYYEIAIDGVPTANSFNLSDGMIDEFLNRSIDEYLLFKNHLAFHIAAYEIFDSLYAYRIAQRLPKRKMRYKYPVESPDTDKLESLPDVLPLIETWHVALNDLSLYAVYLNEKKKP